MRLVKFLLIVIFITTTAFFFTHQRIEAIKLSYKIKEKEIKVNKLLDHKTELEYNVAKLKAPEYLEIQLAKESVELILPERWQIFEVTGLEERNVQVVSPTLVHNIVGLFALKTEAQATPAQE